MTTTDLRERIAESIQKIEGDVKEHNTPAGTYTTAVIHGKREAVRTIMSLVESYSKEMLDDVIENSGALVICDTEQLSFVPKIIKGLKEDQHKIAAKYLTPNTKKGE